MGSIFASILVLHSLLKCAHRVVPLLAKWGEMSPHTTWDGPCLMVVVSMPCMQDNLKGEVAWQWVGEKVPQRRHRNVCKNQAAVVQSSILQGLQRLKHPKEQQAAQVCRGENVRYKTQQVCQAVRFQRVQHMQPPPIGAQECCQHQLQPCWPCKMARNNVRTSTSQLELWKEKRHIFV